MTAATAKMCGHYEYRTAQGNFVHYAVPDEFAAKRPWLKRVANIECGTRMSLDGTVVGKREPASEQAQPNGTFNAKRPSVREYLRAELSLLREGPVSLPVFEERKVACLACTMRNPHPEDQIGLCGACGCGDRIRARLSTKLRMPKATCPMSRWEPASGSGRRNLKHLGGLSKQVRQIVRNALGP